MIVFLESTTNDFTVYFNPPIRASSVRLISCSLFNSWYNLIGGAIMTSASATVNIPDGHYTPITLAKELAKHGYTLTTGLPHEMTIKHDKTNLTVSFGKGTSFSELLGITGKRITNTAIPVKWKVPNSYEVHCSLVKTYNNGSLSNILSEFAPKGNPFDLVEYTPIALSCGKYAHIHKSRWRSSELQWQKDQSHLSIYIMTVTMITIIVVGYLLLRSRRHKKPPHEVSPYLRKPPNHPVKLYDTPKIDAGGSYLI